MSDSYPPYGGQPDPNAAAWGTPPGSPVGQPLPPGSPVGQPLPPGSPVGQPLPPGSPVGQSGYPPQFGAPVPPPPPPYGAPAPKSSKTGLWLGLGIGAAVMAVLVACGGTIGYFMLAADDDESTPVATGPSSPPTGPDAPDAPSAAPPAEPQSDNNNAITARNSSDMSAVCEGSPILNAAPYTAAKDAKVYTFANSPDRPQSWLSKSAGYNKPYYAKTADWATVSVVGCLAFEQGSEGEARKCEYNDRDDKKVTVDYVSSRYTLTFHAAKTGEKIGDGGRINAPAVRCPSFISYNKETMKAYAQPDSGAIELALDKFTS
ncbi:hypothetical protein E0H26_09055 [Micromonospora zingiberis]|uniref:Uncharacterized protein n=1 Tax=Micromonospora zingiberis TaxID=2053011 RepID=A0A4R0GRS2_9ACTN|nr:hypothetical protein [Micromonospora zingiberis]TCB98509.1 hypothetical protein E0H26_09055 [Micromonospora zingiberis]